MLTQGDELCNLSCEQAGDTDQEVCPPVRETRMPGVFPASTERGGKVTAGSHFLMAFCSDDEGQCFHHFYLGGCRKTLKRNKPQHSEITTPNFGVTPPIRVLVSFNVHLLRQT